jgi:hypothetical protein
VSAGGTTVTGAPTTLAAANELLHHALRRGYGGLVSGGLMQSPDPLWHLHADGISELSDVSYPVNLVPVPKATGISEGYHAPC